MKNLILVVDDDKNTCDLVKTFFLSLKYEVKTAFDVSSAIDLLKTEKFDIVITDKNMPGLKSSPLEGGLQLLKYIRENTPDTQVIMMTAYATLDSAISALKMGAFDYIIKPFSLENLKETVSRITSYNAFLDPSGIIKMYNDLQDCILVLLEKTGEGESENHYIIRNLNAKIDKIFEFEQKIEKTIIEQMETLANISSLAGELLEKTALDDENYNSLKKIFQLSKRRI